MEDIVLLIYLSSLSLYCEYSFIEFLLSIFLDFLDSFYHIVAQSFELILGYFIQLFIIFLFLLLPKVKETEVANIRRSFFLNLLVILLNLLYLLYLLKLYINCGT